jgi:hypothetical protein
MSSLFGYLIPDKSYEIGEFKRMITIMLKNSKIIDGYYDEKNSWFVQELIHIRSSLQMETITILPLNM